MGTDHAGIATQMVVERKIAAEEGKKNRHDYGHVMLSSIKFGSGKQSPAVISPTKCAV